MDSEYMLPLDINGLQYAIGKQQILYDVSLQLETGKRLFLLGRNGAGKTTLFSLITTLYDTRKSNADIKIFNHSNTQRRSLKDVGVVFQQRTIDADLTVIQNLRYFAGICGMNKAIARRRITEEVNEFGMTDMLYRKMRHLSGGQVRCIELARALLPNPRLLLLDEPTVGIDFDSRQKVIKRIHALCAMHQVAVLWTTHNMDEVLPDDAVVVLHQGQVVFRGSATELIVQQRTATFADAFTSVTNNAPSVS